MPNPFGIIAGMTPSEDVARFHVLFHAVPNPHPDMRSYSGLWEPTRGLTRVRARSDLFTDDPRGVHAVNLYNRLKKQLTVVYGPSSTFEVIDKDAIWDDDDEFIRSIFEDERVHMTIWSEVDNSKLDAGINEICLQIEADADETASVGLIYNFVGKQADGPGEEVGLSSL